MKIRLVPAAVRAMAVLALLAVLPGSLPVRADEATAPAPASVSEAPAVIEDMVLGNADAPVTIIEYASFTCPHCERFHAEVFGKLKADYIDTGKAKFILREVYFDRFGLWAAMVARCGGAVRYYGMVDLIYDTQKEWIGDGEPATVSANLRTLGKTGGMDEAALGVCLNDTANAEALVAAFEKNMAADNVEGTPTFFINGEKYSNMSYEEFAKILDEKLTQ